MFGAGDEVDHAWDTGDAELGELDGLCERLGTATG
jgi:hypothetical protein